MVNSSHLNYVYSFENYTCNELIKAMFHCSEIHEPVSPFLKELSRTLEFRDLAMYDNDSDGCF